MFKLLFQDDKSGYRKIVQVAAGQAVGTVQVSVPHGLPATPGVVIIEPTSAGQIWQSAAADGTNIYLTADANTRTCNLDVIA